MTPIIRNIQNRHIGKSTETESKLVDAKGWGEKGMESDC